MAEEISTLPVRVKKPLKAKAAGIDEDTHRELAESFEVPLAEDFKRVVTSNGSKVEFVFDGSGEFAGAITKVGGKSVYLIPGVGSNQLEIFKGAPSASNPGLGWTIEVELTKNVLGQVDNQNEWTVFFASRSAVVNNI